MDESATVAIADDQACTHCGYNLRGLKSDGKCPECFTLISHSLRGDLLKYADPDWLDRLHFGTRLKLWNLLIGLAATISSVLAVAAWLPSVLSALLVLVAGGIGVWASFAITTQEPRIALQEDSVTWRKAIRLCAVIAFIAEVLSALDESGQLGGALLIAGGVLSLAGLVTLFGELLYFRRFALRIPDDRLAHSTKIVMWGSLICQCLLLLAVAAVAVTLVLVPPGAAAMGTTPPLGQTGPPSAAIGIVAAACVVGVPGLVFLIWYIVLLFQYKRIFTKAAAESRGFAEAEITPGHGEPGSSASDVGRME